MMKERISREKKKKKKVSTHTIHEKEEPKGKSKGERKYSTYSIVKSILIHSIFLKAGEINLPLCLQPNPVRR